ncbi:hypothetical protein [Pseudomonas sp. NBRC 100443]|uniref:hypothetical protein n=1 Tax=Pseudomonas sp. NBRC 100443 TaxID=1113665 RepID=UPI0024A10045|nr:hypothetical protein [Pseudomonas sp. NBRC 100443]GLU37581.1 hypothetical protein Pssp01_16740 [Pseudomonas sp. NBRC 100443]
MTRKYVVRLDIDTTVCARKLIDVVELGNRLGVKFTIFANMGRSVSLSAAFLRRLSQRSVWGSPTEPMMKLSIRDKIGWKGILESILINPELHRLSTDALLKARDSGHEIGLHGGLNHSLWHFAASSMDADQMHRFLTPAIERYQNILGYNSFGFSSPGFKSSQPAYEILAGAGCAYLSDFIDCTGRVRCSPCGLPDVPVTLSAANTVDFLEWYVASGASSPLENAIEQSIGEDGFGVYYSHPCFIAGKGKQVFSQFVCALREQAEIVTMSELVL